jgi:hypothetical protein
MKIPKSTIISTIRMIVPLLLVAASTILAYWILQTRDFEVFLVFAVLIPVFALLRFDGRIAVAVSIIFSLSSIIELNLYQNVLLSNHLSLYTYWLLLVGVSVLTIEYIRENKTKN